jgi:hypothetical protein
MHSDMFFHTGSQLNFNIGDGQDTNFYRVGKKVSGEWGVVQDPGNYHLLDINTASAVILPPTQFTNGIKGPLNITGSVIVSGSINNTIISGSIRQRLPFISTGNNTAVTNSFIGNTEITGSGDGRNALKVLGTGTFSRSVIVTGSAGLVTILPQVLTVRSGDAISGTYGTVSGYFMGNTSNLTSDELGFTIQPATFGVSGGTGNVIYTNDPTDSYPAMINFQNKATWTDGRISLLRNTDLTGSLKITNGSLTVSGSAYIQSGSNFPSATGSNLVAWNSSTGQLSNTPYSSVITSLFDVGAFYSTGSVTTTANASGSFTYTTTQISNGVTLSNNSRLNISKSGTYNFQFSVQISQGSGAGVVNVWLKKNGNNIADTNSEITVPSNQSTLLSLNLWDAATAGDYYELAYQSNSNNTSFSTIAASGNIPRSPAIIMTVNQVR